MKGEKMSQSIKKVSISFLMALLFISFSLSFFILPQKAYPDSSSYSVGDTGPAGGIIFYVDGNYRLEAAKTDLGGKQWYNGNYIVTGANATGIGTGSLNTQTIISAQGAGDYAAKRCADYISPSGYDDWFLPSKEELIEIYNNKTLIGGFTDGPDYWSSSEVDAEDAWSKYMGGAGGGSSAKSIDFYIRPIREFRVSGSSKIVEPVWVRTQEMTCKQVWINEDNKFQFSFIYPYKDNNWIKIYDMSGKEVFSIDMPYDNPNIIVDLPDGMYTVKTFHDQPEPLQTFVIGKP
jgi:hypothetical protein